MSISHPILSNEIKYNNNSQLTRFNCNLQAHKKTEYNQNEQQQQTPRRCLLCRQQVKASLKVQHNYKSFISRARYPDENIPSSRVPQLIVHQQRNARYPDENIPSSRVPQLIVHQQRNARYPDENIPSSRVPQLKIFKVKMQPIKQMIIN